MIVNRGITGVSVAVGANTAIGTAATTPTLLYGYNLLSGTADTAVSFLNGSSGTALWTDAMNGTTAAGEVSINCMFPEPIIFTSGLYVTLTGTAAVANVCYRNLPV